MAIPASGNIRQHADVANEFGALTAPSPFRLTEALDIIFGSGRTEDSIRDFAGLSKPTNLDTQAATNIDADSATLNAANIGDGGVGTGWYYFEYDDNSSFTSPSYTATVQFNGTASNPSAGISGLSAETTYYSRIVAYNGFNANNGSQGSSDHSRGDTVSFQTASACAAPTNFSAGEQFGGSIGLTWSSSHSPADGWEIQYRINFGSWNLVIDDKGGTARSHTHNGCGSAYSNGDFVEYRIKAQCNEGIEESAWVQSNSVQPSGC